MELLPNDWVYYQVNFHSNYLWDLLIYSLAAAYNNPTTKTTKVHKCSPNQLTTLPVVDNNHDTIDPIIPGNAAAAFPARSASNLPRLDNCFLSNLSHP